MFTISGHKSPDIRARSGRRSLLRVNGAPLRTAKDP